MFNFLKPGSTSHKDLTELKAICQRAIQSGDFVALADLIKSEPILLNYAFKSDKNRTLLHFAVYEQNIQIVEWLLRQKNIQSQPLDFYQQTPLYTAIRFSSPEMVTLLLKRGANPNHHDKRGFTPVIWAVLSAEYTELGNSVPRPEELQARILKILQCLITHQADVRLGDKRGETPLHHAASQGYTFFLPALLTAHASLNVINQYQETALHMAVRHGHRNMVRALLDAGSDRTLKNDKNLTPYQLTAQFDDTLAEQFPEFWTQEAETQSALAQPLGAIKAYQQALRLGDSRAALALAQYPHEWASLVQRSEAGDAEAEFLLAELLLYGASGISKNEKKAIELLLISAQKGNTAAQYTLGVLYENGQGVSQNLEQALAWYQRASARQHGQAAQALQHLKKLDHKESVAEHSVQSLSSSGLPLSSSREEYALLGSFAIQYEELKLSRILGIGGFGIVYEATYRYNTVAVKQLKIASPSSQALEEFQQEMSIMVRLRCPQIVQLYGVYFKPSPGIVMEYLPNGSLYQMIHQGRNPLEWKIRLQIATDMTRGLAFLHQENILYRDLKSLNVLLDAQLRAKLTDFGLAKIKTESNQPVNQLPASGSLLWMAPELFERNGRITQKSDIYSLGMTLWELAAYKTPFKDASHPALVQQWVCNGERESIPQDCPPKLGKAITWCWMSEAAKRPSADQVLALLEAPDETLTEMEYRGNFDSVLGT